MIKSFGDIDKHVLEEAKYYIEKHMNIRGLKKKLKGIM
jgi:hypothetical protein